MGETTMLLLALLAAAAVMPSGAHAQQPDPPVVRASGTGEVKVQPDEATADFGVETAAESAAAAAAENARMMDRVIAGLVAAGVPRERIETRDYMVMPEYVHEPRPEAATPRIRGYRVMNTVSATLYEVDRVGAVIDAALGAGANRVHGVRFGVREPERHRAEAIRRAVARARADAEAMAGALGVTLQGVHEAQTLDSGVVGPVLARGGMMDMAESAPTPIQPGEQTVRATVVVTYRISG